MIRRTAILRRTPLHRNAKPIRRVSQRRAAALYQYGKKRKKFLAAKPTCECCDQAASRDVHHKSGRYGSAFLDENTWLAVCRQCHDWIHSHPRQARERGWLTQLFKTP